LNIGYTVMSKRYLKQLVDEKHVDGWDDPRMPTIVGMRRRGYPPEALRLFMERAGVSKAHQWIDPSVLEDCVREVLNETAPRRIAVLDPLKLVITNYPAAQSEEAFAPNHPQKPELGKRSIPFSGELWIEREDFQEVPAPKYFRLFPGNTVRLKYGYVVKCTGFKKDASGNVSEVQCEYLPDSKSGTPGADAYKVKGVIHWVCAKAALMSEVVLYDRLFKVENPGKDSKTYLDDLNSESMKTITAYLEPSLADTTGDEGFQFERHGYFKRDRKMVLRTCAMRDSWTK
jgi:glutaminyl-tRNA synthetase